jgi:site-specific recombinase XerD
MESEVNAFLSQIKAGADYSESTQQAYANDLRVFLLYLNGSGYSGGVEDLNAELVAGFLAAEREQGRRRNTLIRRLATLKYFQDFLVRSGSLAGNRFSGTDRKIQRVILEIPDKQAAQLINESEVEIILSVFDSSSRPRSLRDRAIFSLLLETGLSVASLISLDMTDIDLAANRLHVNLFGAGDVWLGMNQAGESVKAYIEKGRPNLLDKPGEPALFISQMDGRLSRQGVWQILKYWGLQAEPPIHLSPRIVRHTAALRMKHAGMPSKDIQIRLGHRNLLSTQALIRRLEASCVE